MQDKNHKQIVKPRNWYKKFKDELYRQVGVTKEMTVSEAATVVAEVNPYIKHSLSAICLSEDMGIGEGAGFPFDNPKLIPITRMDLVSEDHAMYYVSLKDKDFANAAGKHPTINIRERERWAELYLYWEQTEKEQ